MATPAGYRPIAGVIDSWPFFPEAKPTHHCEVIDNMMNLELLFLGAQYGRNQTWYNMAVSHAVKTMENNVRPDGSTYQVVQYNYSDGTVYDKLTTQGAGTEHDVVPRARLGASTSFTMNTYF